MKISGLLAAPSRAHLAGLLLLPLVLCKSAAWAQPLTLPVLASQERVEVDLALLVPPGGPSPTTVAIDTPPLHGTLAPSPNGFVYRPDDTFWSLGSDSFVVALDGGSGASTFSAVRLVAHLHGSEPWSDNFEASTLAAAWVVEDPTDSLTLSSTAALQGVQGLEVPAAGAVLTYPSCAEPPPGAHCDPPDGGGEQGGGTVITLRPPRPPPFGEGGESTTIYEAGPAAAPWVDLRLRAGSTGGYELAASALASPESPERRFTPWFPLSQQATRVRLDGWFQGPASTGGLRLWLDDRAVATLTNLDNAGGSFGVHRLGSWGEGAGLGVDIDQVRLHRAADHESSTGFPSAVTLLTADFESGDLSAWGAGPFPAALRVEEAAGLSGHHGLVVSLDEGGAALSRNVEAGDAANLRFRLAAGAAQLPQSQGFKLLTGKRSGGVPVFELWLRLRGSGLQLRAVAIDDIGSGRNTPWLPIEAAEGLPLELQWRASTGAQAGNGLLRLWLGGALAAELSGLDNDGQRLGAISWGAEAVPAGSGGELYLDGLEVWR